MPDEYQLCGPLDELPLIHPNRSLVYKILMVVLWFVVPLFLICVGDLAWEQRKKRKQLLLSDNESDNNIINPLNNK